MEEVRGVFIKGSEEMNGWMDGEQKRKGREGETVGAHGRD